MPQSLANILLHIVFSTRQRLPLIPADIKGKVTNYIDRQEEHHHRKTFQDELRELLRDNEVVHNEVVHDEVVHDERWLWD